MKKEVKCQQMLQSNHWILDIISNYTVPGRFVKHASQLYLGLSLTFFFVSRFLCFFFFLSLASSSQLLFSASPSELLSLCLSIQSRGGDLRGLTSSERSPFCSPSPSAPSSASNKSSLANRCSIFEQQMIKMLCAKHSKILKNNFTWSTSTATAILLRWFRKPLRAAREKNRQKRISRQTSNHRCVIDIIPGYIGISSGNFRKVLPRFRETRLPSCFFRSFTSGWFKGKYSDCIF